MEQKKEHLVRFMGPKGIIELDMSKAACSPWNVSSGTILSRKEDETQSIVIIGVINFLNYY